MRTQGASGARASRAGRCVAWAVLLAVLAISAGAQVPPGAPASPAQRPRRIRPAPPDTSDDVQLSADLVLVSAVVLREGDDEKPVRDLTAADFTVLDEGDRQAIAFFGDESLPLSVAFLFDASDSLKFRQTFQREALAAFLRGLLRPADRASVIWFSSRVHVEQELTSSHDTLLRAIDRIPNGGATALYDSIALASGRIDQGNGRRALVVLSDGRDTFSRTRLDEALKSAQGADVVIFAINTSFPAWSVTEAYKANDPLEFLARETGGEVFYPGRPEEVERTLRLLSSRLRERYVLGFYPTSATRDGRFRRISVSVARKKARVHARTGYYAPAP